MIRRYHIAEANIAELRHPLGSPEMAEFEDQLEPVNRLADSAPGFVWREHFDYSGGRRPIIFGRDDYLFTLSVWEDIEALRNFAYEGRHLEVVIQRLKWFIKDRRPTVALWWIPEGTIPTTGEAEVRLTHLREFGPTTYAFTFRDRFPPGSGTSASTLGPYRISNSRASAGSTDADE